MHLEFLVEELSAQVALGNLLPKILGDDITFDVHAYSGKEDLLRKLPSRLRGYRCWIPEDWHIVVLVDRDDDDCQELKAHLEKIALDAGFVTKSAAIPGANFHVLNRVAVEELEAWFLGDIVALHDAYPSVALTLARQKRYRDPDAILGGTWEALSRILRSYYPTGLPKVEVARNISAHMDPDRNCSRSFQVLCEGLRVLVSN
ncbi:MAG: DUF4276 family protein [Anaerolineae bacterium]|nr:DUF4276 family protein [Anaerolineae bacterium]